MLTKQRPPLYLSLGFPCQVQYILQSFTPPFGRTPFSFSGCRRDVLLAFLRGERDCVPQPKSFIFHKHSKGDIGVCDRDWFYWHDFGNNNPQSLNLSKSLIESVVQKYKHIQKKWDEIDRDRKIYFFIGNSHNAFTDFVKPGETYRSAFGLDEAYVFKLKSALQQAGFTNFKLIVQNRYLEDSIAISERNDPDIIDFYFGETQLSGFTKGFFNNFSFYHQGMTAEFTFQAANEFEIKPLPEKLFGLYQELPAKKSIRLRPAGENFTRCIVERDGAPIGMLRAGLHGFFAAFNLHDDALCTIRYEDHILSFPGKNCYVPLKSGK